MNNKSTHINNVGLLKNITKWTTKFDFQMLFVVCTVHFIDNEGDL